MMLSCKFLGGGMLGVFCIVSESVVSTDSVIFCIPHRGGDIVWALGRGSNCCPILKNGAAIVR